MLLNIFVGFFIGLVAGLLEISMVRNYQKNKMVLAAIVIHWVAIGGVMPFLDFGIPIWAKGVLVGIVLTFPFIFLEIGRSRNAIIHTSIFAPFWGVTIAYGCSYFLAA